MASQHPSVTALWAALRKRAGFTMRELAQEMGYADASSIQRYEDNRLYKKRYIKQPVVVRLAKAIVDRGDPPIELAEVMQLAGPGKGMGSPENGKSPLAGIDELDVRADAGDGAMDGGDVAERVLYTWQMPRVMLDAQTTAPTAGLKIIRVYGSSMVPDFAPGERILVDTDDRQPTPPGAFVVFDGVGLVVKYVEVVPYTDPLALRLISRNPTFGTYERSMNEVDIKGRVVGKWQWT